MMAADLLAFMLAAGLGRGRGVGHLVFKPAGAAERMAQGLADLAGAQMLAHTALEVGGLADIEDAAQKPGGDAVFPGAWGGRSPFLRMGS